jgi:hypothetical protein
MISKELLGEVLNRPINEINYKNEGVFATTIRYWETPNHLAMPNLINIYELAHKCKEWSMKHDYSLNSFLDYNGVWFSYANNVIAGNAKQFTDVTEYEAIFKACQYILDTLTELE